MSKKICKKKTLKLILMLNFCFQAKLVLGVTWKTTTACYGADDDCCTYTLECPSGQTIVLGYLMYGTKKQGAECLFGISDCKTKPHQVTECCTYNASDTFTPFSDVNATGVFENCQGKRICYGWAPRLAVRPYSSYVWMQYTCVQETGKTPDTHVADMCMDNRVTSTEAFIRFNANTVDSQNKFPVDCNCKLEVVGQQTELSRVATEARTFNVTLLDLDFKKPNSIQCSGAELEFARFNRSYDCVSAGSSNTVGFHRMVSLNESSVQEFLSLRNVFANGSDDVPRYILLYVKAVQNRSLKIQCFQPEPAGVATSAGSFSSIAEVSVTTDLPSVTTLASAKSTSLKSVSILTPTSHLKTDAVSTTLLSSALLYVSNSSTVSPMFSSQSPSRSTTRAMSFVSVTSQLTKMASQHTVSLLPQTQTTRASIHISTNANMPFQTAHLSTPSKAYLSSSAVTKVSVSNLNHSTEAIPTYSSLRSKPSASLFSSTSMQTTPSVSPSETTPASSLRGKLSTTLSTGATKIQKAGTSSVGISSSAPPSKVLHQSTRVTYDVNPSIDSQPTNVNEHTTDMPIYTGSLPNDNHPDTDVTTVSTKDDDGNSGLMIGIVVAAVIVVLILVAVVMVAFCIRIKRKEQIRRNYVRNTNIFYSFPEDYDDTGSTKSNSSPFPDRTEQSFTTIPRSKNYEDVENSSQFGTLKKTESPVYFDQYKIQQRTNTESRNDTDQVSYSRMPSDNSYVGETSTETIDFVNSVENMDTVRNSNEANGIKSVSFDPSVYYAQVRKEGKTKF